VRASADGLRGRPSPGGDKRAVGLRAGRHRLRRTFAGAFGMRSTPWGQFIPLFCIAHRKPNGENFSPFSEGLPLPHLPGTSSGKQAGTQVAADGDVGAKARGHIRAWRNTQPGRGGPLVGSTSGRAFWSSDDRANVAVDTRAGRIPSQISVASDRGQACTGLRIVGPCEVGKWGTQGKPCHFVDPLGAGRKHVPCVCRLTLGRTAGCSGGWAVMTQAPPRALPQFIHKSCPFSLHYLLKITRFTRVSRIKCKKSGRLDAWMNLPTPVATNAAAPSPKENTPPRQHDPRSARRRAPVCPRRAGALVLHRTGATSAGLEAPAPPWANRAPAKLAVQDLLG
jgi:hypothetical protein